jgi:hypothetical protein
LRAIVEGPAPTLVPVRQANGHCHWYEHGKCSVHENAPFGCAFFDFHMPVEEAVRRSRIALQARTDDTAGNGLFYRVWCHLRDKGLTSPPDDPAPLQEELRLLRLSMEQN